MKSILLYFCLIIFIVKCGQSLSTKYGIYNSEADKSISGTNSQTYYYLRESSGKYLRWDGNRETNFYGLYFDFGSGNDYQKDWYLFSSEVNASRVRIKNKKTNNYLVLLPSNELILANLKDNDNDFEEEFEILNTTGSWFNLRTSKGLFMTQTIINPFEVSKQIDVYSIATTDSSSKRAELIFEKAENISESNIEYILGTNLTTNDYYCIKIVDNKNENKYLNWDTKRYSHYFGLSLDTDFSDQCSDIEQFWFKVEVDVNGTNVKIKNKESTGYIVYHEEGQYFLLSDLKSAADPELNLILSPDNKIIIKTYSHHLNQTNYLSDKSLSKHFMGISMNEAVQQLNESARFVFVKKDTGTKSDAHVIDYCFYNTLFISVFAFVFANILYK